MTAKFNGYYNADVIMDETFAALDDSYEDNYNRILAVYPYAAVETSESVRQELDRAIAKVTKVSRLHESSKWVDDCYVLMGKAQYLQGNYEAAEETLEYFVNNFNPRDPDSRIYKEKESSSRSKAKQRQKKAQEARKQRLKERKEKEKQREKDIKEKKKERKEISKEREQARKDREKSNRDGKKADSKKSNERKQKIKEREEAASASKEDKKDLSAEEARKQRIKERKQQIADRRKAAKETQKEREKLRGMSREERKAEEEKKKQAEDTQIASPVEEIEETKETTEDIAVVKVVVEEEAEPESLKEEESAKKEESAEKEEEDNKKKSKKQSKQTELQDPAKGGFFKHQPAYYEGMMWLAKTYIARENFVTAKYYIDRIEQEEGVPAKVINEIPVVRSDLYVQQKKYEDAVAPLEQSIVSTKNKNLKARYAFILAQIHQLNGNPADAADAFAKVEKYSKRYEMSLNAQLNQVKNSWAGGRTTFDRAIRELRRMERDKKNTELIGAIYFTRAEIKLASDDKAGAIEDFEYALSSSISTINTIESYYRLGTLYYGLEDYVKAKSYFDSTATSMSKKDDRYTQVVRQKSNLREVVKNILIIQEKDSLLEMSKLSEAELIAYAEGIIAERERQAAKAFEVTAGAPPPAKTTGGVSKFFAYNTRSVQKGKQDFSKRWGNRALEDDWRRSSRQSSIIVEEEEVKTLEELDEDRRKEIEKILRPIPRNKREKGTTLAKVEQAYFDLGIAYRNYIKNYKKSAEALEAFIDRFPKGKNVLDAYYYLYLNYKDLGDAAQSQMFYDRITRNYPRSDYAKVLKDPSYALQLLTEEKKVQNAYDAAYQYFDQADFQSAYDAIIKAKKGFGNEHDLVAKYDLLEAMCIGHLKGKDSYVAALKTVVIKHINTPEQTKAREMLRFLRGDSEAFDGEISNEELEDFTRDDDKLHYIIISLFEADGNLVNEAKNSINLYNASKYKDRRIRSTSIYLNQKTKTHLVLLRRFENKKVAMDYFVEISKDVDEFLNPAKFSYEIFAVNQKNYREIVKQKSIRTYRLFFETYYLIGE